MAQKSFIEILETQIRQDLRGEIEAEVRAQIENETSAPGASTTPRPTPHTTTAFWQMTTPRHKTVPSAKAAYGAPKAFSPAPKVAPAAVVAVTAEEIMALELLQRNAGRSASVCLGSSTAARCLTHTELKTLWRTAALRTHPDRVAQADLAAQTQAAALFRELTHAYEVLERMFDGPAARAA